MAWSIRVDPAGLVWADLGPSQPELKEALQDCVQSLSPAGMSPALSTYWIDRVRAGLSGLGPTEAVLASGNAWSLVRRGDTIAVRFDYAEEGEMEGETIGIDELREGLTAYRDAVLQALREGHQRDERWWAQMNPG
jgi:hypothetical protein